MNNYSYEKSRYNIVTYGNKFPTILKIAIFLLFLSLFKVFSSWQFLLVSTIIYFITSFLYLFKRKVVFVNSYSLWGIIFFSYTTLSILWTYDISSTLLGIRSVLQFVLIGVFTISIVQSLAQFIFIIKCGVVSGLILIIRIILSVPFQRILVRDFGVLNANGIGLALCISLILLLILHEISHELSNKTMFLLVLFIFAFGIIITASRKAILLLGYILLSWIYFTTEKPLKKIIFMLLIVSCIGIVLYFLINNQILYNYIGRRFEGAFNLLINKTGYIDASSSERKALIEKGLELWQNKLAIGYGASTFSEIAGFGKYSHNNYIEIGVNLGIIGVIFFYNIYIILMVRILKIRNLGLSRFLIFLMIFFLVMDFAWVSLVEDLYLFFLVIVFIYTKIN